MPVRQVTVFPDVDSLNAGTAEWLSAAVAHSLGSQGRCSLAFSGGNTPRALYRLLADASWRSRFSWESIQLFQVDERLVPVDDPRNNFAMIERELLRAVPIPESNVHRVRTELGLEGAAREYEFELRRALGGESLPHFDVLLLGVGDDGHTASLFPGSKALHESSRMVVGNTAPGIDTERITLTLPVINAARKVLFMVAGSGKAEILRDILQGDSPETRLPAAMVNPSGGLLYWHLDSPAASLLHVQLSE